MSRYRGRKNFRGDFDQNDGVPGVVYILRNEAFKDDWLKIGCSRHSGHIRAQSMNEKASTGIPAHHVCVFQVKTLDCGRAEKRVHSILSKYRTGKQEFFKVDIELAKRTIEQVCAEFDGTTPAKNTTNVVWDRLPQVLAQPKPEVLPPEVAPTPLRQVRVEERVTAPPAAQPQRVTALPRVAIQPQTAKTHYVPAPQEPESSSWITKVLLPITLVGIVTFSFVTSRDGPTHTKTTEPSNPPAAKMGSADTESHRLQHHFEEVYKSHPDAFEIVGSAKFKAWLSKSSNQMWRETPQKGSATQVIAMLDQYKLDLKAYIQQSKPQANQAGTSNTSDKPPVNAKFALKDFRVRSDVMSAMQRAYADYPYLQTEDGSKAVRLILLRAIDLVQAKGFSPADAIDKAVMQLAQRHEPAWYKTSLPVADEQKTSPEPEKRSRPCRLVSTSPVNFECS